MKNKKSVKKVKIIGEGVVVIMFVVLFIYVSTFIDNDSGDFNLGTYNFTFYNSSGFVQLNSSRLNGSYTSQIFNGGLWKQKFINNDNLILSIDNKILTF